MLNTELFMQLAGAARVAEWFGEWPSLHDAEIVEVVLRRSADSFITVHGFRMTREVNERGFYICDKHALITFTLQDVSDSELLGFNSQNVISSMNIERNDKCYRLVLGGCFGLEGWLEAANIAVAIVPGIPPGSIYEGLQKKEFCS